MTTSAVLAPGHVPAGPVRPVRSDVLRTFRTPVRGHAFAAAPSGSSEPEAGLRARLAREPANPADPLAVAVWVDDDRPWRIGYLDRGVAARVAPRIDAGLQVDARVEGWVEEPEGRWHRPLVRIVPDTARTNEAMRAIEPETERLPQAAPSPASSAAPAEPTNPPALWQRPPGVTRRVVR